jgi:hypothetical protein
MGGIFGKYVHVCLKTESLKPLYNTRVDQKDGVGTDSTKT